MLGILNITTYVVYNLWYIISAWNEMKLFIYMSLTLEVTSHNPLSYCPKVYEYNFDMHVMWISYHKMWTWMQLKLVWHCIQKNIQQKLKQVQKCSQDHTTSIRMINCSSIHSSKADIFYFSKNKWTIFGCTKYLWFLYILPVSWHLILF